MNSTTLISIVLLIFLGNQLKAQNQQNIKDTLTSDQLDEILIASVRVTDKTPVSFSNLTKKEISKRNLGQDIPVLMNFMPSVVTTSDAGNGVGYTGIRVRGTDATRVNVTINGIPYNDSESHGTFWVNMPDFASSTQSLQLQRGVGSSTNGAGAFGASLNVLTDAFSYDANAEISNSFGSFNTRKHTLKFSSGLMNNSVEITGRLSKLHSDGYIDRASAKMHSYFLQGSFIHNKTLIKALVFGGNQKTYQAWNGVTLEDINKFGRRYNPAGAYKDKNGAVSFYDNETDNYKQQHYQLHWNERWSENWNTNIALHYTKGFGYYENYKSDEKLKNYFRLTDEKQTSDLIRQKILDNDFYGITFSATFKKDDLEIIFGGAANNYQGKHIGKVQWIKSDVNFNYNQNYYNDLSTKNEANFYTKLSYHLSKKWIAFADVQFRGIRYKTDGSDTGFVNDKFLFFNPKAGITYVANAFNSIYFSFAKAQREPNRTDYQNGKPKPEKLNDLELGWRYNTSKSKLNINAYFMHYQNQLVLTGALDDVGAPIRENSGKSYRLGLEMEWAWQISKKWMLQPNVTISKNKNLDFVSQRNGKVEHLNNTSIAFSPNIVAGNRITFMPFEHFEIHLLTKYVGAQYMGNTNSEASKLKAYWTNDINIIFSMPIKKWFKSIEFNLLANNILNHKYISNGYYGFYDETTNNQIQTIEYSGYYPQATFNILGGVTLKF